MTPVALPNTTKCMMPVASDFLHPCGHSYSICYLTNIRPAISLLLFQTVTHYFYTHLHTFSFRLVSFDRKVKVPVFKIPFLQIPTKCMMPVVMCLLLVSSLILVAIHIKSLILPPPTAFERGYKGATLSVGWSIGCWFICT